MHDPMVVVFEIKSPIPRQSKAFKGRWRRSLITVWHDEPKGADSGTICKGMGGTEFTWHNVKWAWKHRRHLSVHVEPYLRVKRWLFYRCDECGYRFFWKQPRMGAGWDSPHVLHFSCDALRMTKAQLEDLKNYVQFDVSETQRWRVENMILKDADS
jgi:hypothetical protein